MFYELVKLGLRDKDAAIAEDLALALQDHGLLPPGMRPVVSEMEGNNVRLVFVPRLVETSRVSRLQRLMTVKP